MKRELTKEEMVRIAQSVASGARVEAINMYLSIARCGLSEAQRFVRELPEELKTVTAAPVPNKKHTQRLFGKY